MEETYYGLILAYFDKTISDEGLTRLQDWIEADAENQAQFIDTIQILEASRAALKTPQCATQSWTKVQAHALANPVNSNRIFKPRRWLQMAAACVVLSVSGWWGYRAYVNDHPDYATISNADGKHAKIVLPDNSTVILGGGSTLQYAKNFDGDKRMILLDGEAFFDVVHLEKKPFVVKTGEISTIVLGTSFNIKAYKADNKVAVTVLTGKVGVVASMQGQEQMVKHLTPNEQISIDTQSGIYTFNNADAEAERSWINNELSFYNRPFKDIASSLEHHYGVKISFADAELCHARLTAKFNNASLARVMDDLCALSGSAYTQKNKQIFITNHDQKGGSIMK